MLLAHCAKPLMGLFSSGLSTLVEALAPEPTGWVDYERSSVVRSKREMGVRLARMSSLSTDISATGIACIPSYAHRVMPTRR